MFAERGVSVVAIDLDPQANLSSMFVDEDRMESLWDATDRKTVYGAIEPLLDGKGDIVAPYVEKITQRLGLVVGDWSLFRAEDDFSSQWAECLVGNPRAFRVASAFWRVIESAAKKAEAEIVLMDLAPSVGAINRAAMIAAEYVVVPLMPNLPSLQGLSNLGPTLRRWQTEWRQRIEFAPDGNLSLPLGSIQTIGYVVLQYGMRSSRPVQADQRWLARIPNVFRKAFLEGKAVELPFPAAADDPYCLAMLKHYRSLMPLAMEAHKPMFHLKPADGAIGAHVSAVRDCYNDFRILAGKIAGQVGIHLS